MPREATQFKRGNPGRPKGAVNKVTRTLREAAEQSFDEVGSVAYLKRVAKTSPATYLGFIGRLLPLQVEGNPDRPLVVRWQDDESTD